MSEQERELYCSSVQELTQLALSRLPNSVDLVNEKPISNYFGGLRKLLRSAAASRQEADWERMYMALVQYLMTTVKLIPQHEDCENEDFQEEYENHKGKTDLVRQELEGLKERLTELYENAEVERESEEEEEEEEEEVQEKMVQQQQHPSDDEDLSYASYTAEESETEETSERTQRQVASGRDGMAHASSGAHVLPSAAVAVTSAVSAAKTKHSSIHGEGLTAEEIEEKRTMDRKLETRLSERLSKKDIKERAKVHRQETRAAKRKHIENRLENMMDAMRRGERPHIYNAKKHITMRPLPGTVFEEDEGTIRARQEIQWRNRIRQQRERFMEDSMMQMDNRHLMRRPHYEEANATPSRTMSQRTMSPADPHAGSPRNRYHESNDNSSSRTVDRSASGMFYGGASRIAHNEQVQQRVGAGVANLAQNEAVQQRIATGVEHVAKNDRYMSSIGEAVAQSSDNYMVQQVARNKTAQRAVGTALVKTVGNKDVQKRVGHAVASAATNREVQKKVATGFLSMGRMAAKGGVAAAKVGAKATVAGAKIGYDVYQNRPQE